MKKTLLAGASLAVMFTAANALATDYTGKVDISTKEEIVGNKTMNEADVNIVNSENAPANLVLKDNATTLDVKNSQVRMSGAPDGKMNGINSTDGMSGTVNLGENTRVDITKGAGIAVSAVNINEGAVVNASGYMDVSNPAQPKWRSGSMIQGDKELTVADGATVNLSDGGMMVVGYNTSDNNNHMDIDGTVNMSGKDALIRASSSQDGTNTSTLNVGGAVNILKDASGIIASRITNVLADGIVNVASESTLDIIQDMNRAVDGGDTGKPTGDKAEFNVAGSLINNGTINAENADITIKGAALAAPGDDNKYADQAAGGSYVSNNGTLNGDLTLTGVNTPAGGDSADKIAAILKSAPKAEFSGTNSVNGDITNTAGLITVNKGASLTLGEGKSVTNNGIIDLSGALNATVSGAGSIAIQDSDAHLTSFAGNSLDINADTASSKLVADASTATQVYVKEGVSFNIDNDKIATDDLVSNGQTKLGVDYSSAKVKVGNGGSLDLGSNTLTSSNGVNLWGNSTLAFNVDKAKTDTEAQAGGKIAGNIITNLNTDEETTINPVIGLGAGNGTYQYADAVTKGVGIDPVLNLTNKNVIYKVSFDETDKSILNISKKNSSEVTSEVVGTGGTFNNADTINAWVGGNSDGAALTGSSGTMAEHLNTLAQTNPQALIDAVTALAPDTAAVVQSTSTENANQIFGAVGNRLSGGSVSTGGKGMSSGDSNSDNGAMWVQGLYNHAKLSDTRKSKGFDADSQGIALGAEKYISNDVKLGLGYAYNTSDIDGFLRTTDVDTHTAIAYGEYKPSDWYVNGIATYGWSDYSEKKNVAGINVDADYDINTVGLQAMTGYNYNVSGVQLTPETGLRYVNIRQDSYRDSSGQKVSENTSDILTGVIGAKVQKSFMLDNGIILRPEARVAMTYDMVNDPTSSVVTLANGSAYTVSGEALDRTGWEAGAGLTADVNQQVELSLGYEGRFRNHYEDHTGLVNAKYKF